MPVINIKIVAGGHSEQDAYKTFDDRGGVIGRAEECDWVLSDLTRVVSKQHAVISYEQGQFWIEDISTNGVLVGAELVPLGRGNRRCLLLRDQFKIGDFVFQTEQPAESALTSLDITQGHSSSELLAILNNKNTDQHAFEIKNSELPPPQVLDFEVDDIANTFGVSDSFSRGNINPPVIDAPQVQVKPLPDDWELSGFFNAAELSTIALQKQPQVSIADSDSFEFGSLHEQPISTNVESLKIPPQQEHVSETNLMSGEIKLATEDQSLSPSRSADGSPSRAQEVVDGTQRVYEALGLPPELFSRIAPGNFDTEIASIVQATTSGLMNLLQARAQFKHDTRMSLTQISARSNNPLKFCIEAGDALEMMLVKKKPGYLNSAEAFEEAIRDLKVHQAAFISGLQAALSGVLAELAPERIEQELKSGMLGKVEMVAHAQAWKLYRERQYQMSQAVIHNFSEVMGKYFSDAYEKFVAESMLGKE